jgi:hypothetical protein
MIGKIIKKTMLVLTISIFVMFLTVLTSGGLFFCSTVVADSPNDIDRPWYPVMIDVKVGVLPEQIYADFEGWLALNKDESLPPLSISPSYIRFGEYLESQYGGVGGYLESQLVNITWVDNGQPLGDQAPIAFIKVDVINMLSEAADGVVVGVDISVPSDSHQVSSTLGWSQYLFDGKNVLFVQPFETVRNPTYYSNDFVSWGSIANSTEAPPLYLSSLSGYETRTSFLIGDLFPYFASRIDGAYSTYSQYFVECKILKANGYVYEYMDYQSVPFMSDVTKFSFVVNDVTNNYKEGVVCDDVPMGSSGFEPEEGFGNEDAGLLDGCSTDPIVGTCSDKIENGDTSSLSGNVNSCVIDVNSNGGIDIFAVNVVPMVVLVFVRSNLLVLMMLVVSFVLMRLLLLFSIGV